MNEDKQFSVRRTGSTNEGALITLISAYPDIYAIGMRILSACLKQRGHRVRLIFLPETFGGTYSEAVLEEVATLAVGSDLIGISLMTDQFHKAVQITQKLKARLEVPLIWGGVHPTMSPEECLEYVDMICIGEGEGAMVELADKLADGEDFYETRNIWFKRKDTIIRNKMRPLIQDLDSIPAADYELEEHYILSEGHVLKADASLLQKHYRPYYITIPSRGCPYSCTYCCNNRFNRMYPGQKTIRKRSLDAVVNELEVIMRKLPFLSEIWFDDDSFFLYTEEEIRNFSQSYKVRIGLPLRIGGATPLTITRKKLALLVDGGLIRVRMGIQSGAERTKKMYHRRHTNQEVAAAVKIINEFRECVLPTYDVIIDNPWEDENDLIETLRFMARLPGPYRLGLFSLNFYPGTELFDRAVKEGLISPKSKDYQPKVYYHFKETHLNRLFLLLAECALEGKIPTRMLFALTNNWVRRLKLHRLLYSLFRRWRRAKSLLRQLREALCKREWSKISQFFLRRINKWCSPFWPTSVTTVPHK